MLSAVRGGEWMTPDLLQKFQGNEILSRGLRDPRCMQVLQQLQQLNGKTPNKQETEMINRLKGDPFIDAFLREFGKVMAAHFESLEVQSKASSGQSATSTSTSTSTAGAAQGASASPVQPIQELGPLHADVLKRQK